MSRGVSQTGMPLSKLAQEFLGKIPRNHQVSRRCGEAFQLPRKALRQIFFLHMVGTALRSVIAVPRANRSLIVFREGIGQLTCLAW